MSCLEGDPTYSMTPGLSGQLMISNSAITGGNFTLVNGNYTVNNGSREAGIQILSQAISYGAMHDSSERYPPPKCHPGTREKIIEKILDWTKDPDPDPKCDVVWVNGLLGVGKSAIMQAVADHLRENEIISGSFFFGRGAPRRDKAQYLIPTIAYQIATNFPGMREHINDAMIRDPSLPTKSINIQFQSLIVGPFALCSVCDRHTAIIIIDGLDECDGFDGQRSVLDVVGKSLSAHHLPLRFLIASRPEPQIRNVFGRNPLSDLLWSIEVGTGDDDDDKEIELYLSDGFDEIHERFSYMSSVAKPWPSWQDLQILVRRASGQFLYASTVLKFVGADRYNPMKQLQVILAPHPRRAEAFSNIDRLYIQILKVCPYREDLLRVLGMLVTGDFMTTDALEDIWDLRNSEVAVVLNGLHSLISIDKSNSSNPNMATWTSEERAIFSLRPHQPPTEIDIRHTSFSDFLVDETRAGSFYIDCEAVEKKTSDRIDVLYREALCQQLNYPLRTRTWSFITWNFVDMDNVDHLFSLALSTLKSVEPLSFKTLSWRSAQFVEALKCIVMSVQDDVKESNHRSNVQGLCLRILDDVYRAVLSSSPLVLSLAQGVAMAWQAQTRLETTFGRSGLALESVTAILKDPMVTCLFDIHVDANKKPILFIQPLFEKFLFRPKSRSGHWGVEFRMTCFPMFENAWRDLQRSSQEDSLHLQRIISHFLNPDFYQSESDTQDIVKLLRQTDYLSGGWDSRIHENALRWVDSQVMPKDPLYVTTTTVKELWETLFAIFASTTVSLNDPRLPPGLGSYWEIPDVALPPDGFMVTKSRSIHYRDFLPKYYDSLSQCLRRDDVTHPSVTLAHCHAKIVEWSIRVYVSMVFYGTTNNVTNIFDINPANPWTEEFFESKLEWEEHMSQACASSGQEILHGLKAIYRILVELGGEKKYKPPVTFLLGILAFLKNQVEPCEYLKVWCEGLITK